MKKNIFLVFCIIFYNCASIFAQYSDNEINIAELNIVLDQDAKNKITSEYNKIAGNTTFLETILPKMQLFFPTIERVLEEEGVPEDFKYLAAMESDLNADATNTNLGVGFWLFKKDQAIEAELRIDAVVDERKHLIASTKALCLSLKRNNLILNNWALTLLSHSLGLNNVRRLANADWTAKKSISLSGKTDLYILKFLAYKSYLEPQYLKVKENKTLYLYEYVGIRGKSFYDIAKELSVEVKEIQKNNVWLQSTSIPDDKEYVIYLPVNSAKLDELSKQRSKEIFLEKSIDFSVDLGFPVLKRQSLLIAPNDPDFYEINGKNGIKAVIGDTPESISQRAGLNISKFLKYNDLQGNEKIIPNEIYYLAKKDKSAVLPYHTVLGFETLWKVSQMYGITLEELKKKNRISGTQRLIKGRRLWLFSTRPENESIEVLSDIASKKSSASIDSSFASTDTVHYSKISVMGRPMEVIEQNKPASDIFLKEEPIVEAPVRKARKPIFVYETPDAIIQNPIGNSKSVTSNTYKSTDNEEHTVESQETFFSIAKKYGIPLADLYSINNFTNNYKLKVGEIIKIKETKVQANISSNIDTNQVAKLDENQEDEFLSRRVNKITKILYENETVHTESAAKLANVTSHTVAPTETFYSISKKYSINLSELYDLNKIGENDRIKVGQVLKIRPIPEIYASIDNAPGNTRSTKNIPVAKTEINNVVPETPKKMDEIETIPENAKVLKMVLHKVLPNETLGAIAKKYKVNVSDITTMNGFDANTNLSAGQLIKIKESSNHFVEIAPQKEVIEAPKVVIEKNQPNIPEDKLTVSSHTVKSKETLFSIAKKYNVTIKELSSLNNLKNNNLILGQKLTLPENIIKNTSIDSKIDVKLVKAPSKSTVVATTKSQTHTIKKGETIFRIAKLYGMKAEDLIKMNKIKGNKISLGQKLIVKRI